MAAEVKDNSCRRHFLPPYGEGLQHSYLAASLTPPLQQWVAFQRPTEVGDRLLPTHWLTRTPQPSCCSDNHQSTSPQASQPSHCSYEKRSTADRGRGRRTADSLAHSDSSNHLLQCPHIAISPLGIWTQLVRSFVLPPPLWGGAM